VEGTLHVVRVDPGGARLRTASVSERGSASRTAAEWSREENLAVAVNLGMYLPDLKTSVGYLKNARHLNNPRWNPAYHSVLAFDPLEPADPRAILADAETIADGTRLIGRYGAVAQSLRLIRSENGRGVNVWARRDKRWSEAALAADASGRLLILFCRRPFSMWEFNEALLGLGLGIVRAMHLEGGAPASLSIHAGGLDLDLAGGEGDDVSGLQWPIPNVLGVAR
jgi:hypothetical protein